MIDQRILSRIKEYALYVDWHVAFDGKANGNQHLFRVVIIAQFLAEKEGARRKICEAGAWLHDVALVAGNDDNPASVRAIADRYLMESGIDRVSGKWIAECIETHLHSHC
ncbi:MAG TPA: HD domain-containing protein [Ktedonobacteraceae bacterium]|nr:HD domain-containing protein [Ktedonobacteraceae bacterium]